VANVAVAEDELVKLQPFAEGVEFAMFQPEGWESAQRPAPKVLTEQPKVLLVAGIKSPDGLIHGEVKYAPKETEAVKHHAHQFFKDYSTQVFNVKLVKDVTINGDEEGGAYRMEYLTDKNDILVEQVCNGATGAVSLAIFIPHGHPLTKVAVGILNHPYCLFHS
jgi:hypothetical protein